MSEAKKFDLRIQSSREEIIHINACPDSEYPIRILEAYLEMQMGTYCMGSGGAEELADIMNEAQEERAALLHRAIALLRAETSTPFKVT
jgi:hypothetical protein